MAPDAPFVSDYQLLRRIGGGAYGEVWLARSKATGVLRAAKIVWRNTFADERPFRREFEGLQRFEQISRGHPSQLALFHIGRNESEGYFYSVMELADDWNVQANNFGAASIPDRASRDQSELVREGEMETHNLMQEPLSYTPHTLRTELALGRLRSKRVLEIGLALTEALGHLHSHGLVHRDVKPSNVIFVNGRPKLADIGLVTDASDQCSIVGTEGYLPPEGPGTHQADIFALGKVIYEMITGLDRRQFPDLPPDLKEWTDPASVVELNEIVLRACKPAVHERYSTTEVMRGDLALLAGGESVRRAYQRKRRWQLTRRGAAWVVVLTAVSSLVLLVSRLRQEPVDQDGGKRSTNDLANRYFVLGKTHFDLFRGTNFQFAADNFKKAIQADTNFALAYGYLASTYFWRDDPWNIDWRLLPEAKTLALEALGKDKRLAEPHLALGWFHALKEWNWTEAEKEDRTALALNSSSSFCHLCYAELLRMEGKTNGALQEIYQARSLDPHSRIINVRLIHYFICARRFEDALAQVDQVQAMEAVGDLSLWRRDIFMNLGDTEKAIDAVRGCYVAAGESAEKIGAKINELKRTVAAEGIRAIWRLRLEEAQGNRNLYDQAESYIQLGQTDAAFDCIETLLRKHDTMFTFNIMTDWMFDPIRSTPRFHSILKGMHLE